MSGPRGDRWDGAHNAGRVAVYTVAGVIGGLLLALATILGGVAWLVLAVVFAAVGGAVGAHLDGSIDLTAVTRGRGRG